jgi:hypothetical protein
LVAIVAAQFEAIRAPTQIGAVDGDAPIMTPFLSTARIALQQKTMGFHDPIDPFVVGRLMPLSLGRAPQNSPAPTMTVSRHLSDHRSGLLADAVLDEVATGPD